MPINADKPHLWKQDIQASVDLFNTWFMAFAPKAYRDTRVATTQSVEEGLRLTGDLANVTPAVLRAHAGVLPTLRMATCPPLARDRLTGLAGVSRSLVEAMEGGKLPPRMAVPDLDRALAQIAAIIVRLRDPDLFPWLAGGETPTETERYRAATIVADRLCGAVSDPIVRNAQEKRQLALLGQYLEAKGYRPQPLAAGRALGDMEAGTFCFRTNVVVGDARRVNIPIDVIVQPRLPRANGLPILIEAKSAGDFANVNKRRKEEGMKAHQLRTAYGPDIPFILLLCGYFDGGYLGYEAAEGIDWVWEHRLEDMDQLGL